MLKNQIVNPILRNILELVFFALLAILVFFALRTFIFRNASVIGSSMSPTLSHGDMVIINRLSYYFISPQAGDIVAFPYQGDPSEIYIKRVIGMPGDIINFENGHFYINDERLRDPFSTIPVFAMGDVVFPITVEQGHFFVLGDNRNVSKDSRFTSVGNVPESDMIGKALIRIWPLGSFGVVN